MSVWDDLEDIGQDVVDAASDVGDDLVEAASDLFEGPGQLVGIMTAGAALFVVGPGAVVPAFVAGAATGNALIRHRHLTGDERAFVERVFETTLPPDDRVVLTNLTGIEGRKFVCPNASGQALVNLGEAYDDPVHYQDDKYPAPGKVLVHELTHVWQLHHATFVPGLVCEGIANQLAGAQYRPGPGGGPWAGYNLEQQATIVDEWFAPGARGPAGFRPMRPEHPFYRYVEEDVRGRPLSRAHAMVGSGQAVARVDDHLDVFWRGPDGAVASQWWDAAPGYGWGDHQPFTLTAAGAAAGEPAVVCRRLDHVDVFWVAPDGSVGSHWWNVVAGFGWGDHPAFSAAPPGAAHRDSAVCAVGRQPEHLDVFWVGPDGAVASQWWDAAPGSGWGDHQPFPVTPPGAARPASVTAVARTPDHLDVFWIGPDGAVASQWWDAAPGSGWGEHQPFPITPPGAARPGSPVVAVARTPNHLDVFWIGPDGAVASQWWDAAPGCGWGEHQPFPITPPGAAQAAAASLGLCVVARTAEHLDVFWVGPDGAVASQWWDAAPGSGWGDHQPFPITPPGAARAGSLVSAVCRGRDHLDVFWVGPDGAVASQWWDAAPGSGWGDHQPFPVTPPHAAALDLVGDVRHARTHVDVGAHPTSSGLGRTTVGEGTRHGPALGGG